MKTIKVESHSPEFLRRILRYDDATGKLYWLSRTPDLFPDNGTAARMCKNWNAKYAGGEALITENERGYKRGTIQGVPYRNHRVVWALLMGEWPKGVIDHINGDTSDNRIENLRDVSQAENVRNSRINAKNTSGVCGVSWHRKYEVWSAAIRVNGRDIHLGQYKNKKEAIAARKAGEICFGFHENHGRARSSGGEK